MAPNAERRWTLSSWSDSDTHPVKSGSTLACYRRAVPRTTSLLILLALVAVAKDLQARSSARLVYVHPEADATCPDEIALRGMIASQLGYDPFDDGAPVQVHAAIERVGNRLRGRVTLTRDDGTRGGERILDATNDCSSVATALALTVSVAIDTLEAPPPAPPLAVNAPAPESITRPSQPPTETAAVGKPNPADAPTPVSFRGTVDLHVALGVAPSTAFGGAVSFGARWPLVSVALEARGDLPAFAPLSTGGELGTSVILGMVVPCAHVRSFVGCGIFGVGSMHGESRSVPAPDSNYAVFGAAGVRVGLELPLSRFLALRPQIDGLVAWARPKLRFDDQNVWTAPAASATFGLAAIVQSGGLGGF